MAAFTVAGSPVGPLLLVASEAGTELARVWFDPTESDLATAGERYDAHPLLVEAAAQLDAYGNGYLTDFTVPLDLRGTPFQLRVWDELTRIPYGTTISYGELARRLGAPKASRAVGLANGRNPVAIIVPCHRVIGASGRLTGYGGGIERKRWLLDHEAGLPLT